MSKGICILIEAPDGAGKDTLIENVKKQYKNMDFKVYQFPNGKFREALFGKNAKPRTQLELVPLFCENFKESIAQIKKDLAEGKNIIINRMYISTILYATESGVPPSMVYYHIDRAIGNWRPDLTFLMDISPQEAFKRLQARNEEKNWLDGTFEKQIRINSLYKKFYKEYWKNLYKSKDNIIQLDCNGSKEDVINLFCKKFDLWNSKELKKSL